MPNNYYQNEYPSDMGFHLSTVVFYNGCTFELKQYRPLHLEKYAISWVSMKTAIDPIVNRMVQERGLHVDEDVVKAVVFLVHQNLKPFLS